LFEVAERQLSGVQPGGKAEVRTVTGQKREGTIRFVSKKASAGTRTYRVDVEVENKDGAISDGLTSEVDLLLAPVPAARVPRSALTFSSGGQARRAACRPGRKVASRPSRSSRTGSRRSGSAVSPRARSVIVEGQDFVKEGETVRPSPPARRG
jgi:multidrug efflux system membrane fusion protein